MTVLLSREFVGIFPALHYSIGSIVKISAEIKSKPQRGVPPMRYGLLPCPEMNSGHQQPEGSDIRHGQKGRYFVVYVTLFRVSRAEYDG